MDLTCLRRNIYRVQREVCLVMLLPIFLMVVFCPEIEADGDSAVSQREFEVLISNSVRSITADANDVWIATDSGVSRFSQRDGRWTSYTKDDGLVSDNVYVVASDGGEVWFGTDNGVSRYKSAQNEWTTYREKDGLVSNTVHCITQDANYVWIGTDSGLARFDTNISSWAARTHDGPSTPGEPRFERRRSSRHPKRSRGSRLCAFRSLLPS